jgi:hypothetical protein
MPTAFVFINKDPASMPEVLKKIKAIEEVKEATWCMESLISEQR